MDTLAILQRRLSIDLLERVDKAAAVTESIAKRYIGNTVIGLEKILFSMIYTESDKVISKSDTHTLLEKP